MYKYGPAGDQSCKRQWGFPSFWEAEGVEAHLGQHLSGFTWVCQAQEHTGMLQLILSAGIFLNRLSRGVGKISSKKEIRKGELEVN